MLCYSSRNNYENKHILNYKNKHIFLKIFIVSKVKKYLLRWMFQSRGVHEHAQGIKKLMSRLCFNAINLF